MFNTTTLKTMPYANAKIRKYDNGKIELMSYKTIVATLENNVLTIFGLYSMTTRKHISAFMREYTPFNYATAKQLYNDNVSMDIATGEIFDN